VVSRFLTALFILNLPSELEAKSQTLFPRIPDTDCWWLRSPDWYYRALRFIDLLQPQSAQLFWYTELCFQLYRDCPE